MLKVPIGKSALTVNEENDKYSVNFIEQVDDDFEE